MELLGINMNESALINVSVSASYSMCPVQYVHVYALLLLCVIIIIYNNGNAINKNGEHTSMNVLFVINYEYMLLLTHTSILRDCLCLR